MTERAFVSSTCYDLIDVRHELEVALRDLGLAPVMSDRPTSEFEVDPYLDSIRTCLVNVRSCDHFICVLNQRYGPRLGKHGFSDLSATHLEYEEAKREGKPILFLVRDRLVADYDFWRANGKDDKLALRWVPESDRGLLEFMHEHQKLVTGSGSTNWYDAFTSVVDLKQVVRERLKASSLKAAARRLCDWSESPWLVPLHAHPDGPVINLTNTGRTPALNVEVALAGLENWKSLAHILPRASASFDLLPASVRSNPWLQVRFRTVNGYHVEDRFDISYKKGVGLVLAFRERVVLAAPA